MITNKLKSDNPIGLGLFNIQTDDKELTIIQKNEMMNRIKRSEINTSFITDVEEFNAKTKQGMLDIAAVNGDDLLKYFHIGEMQISKDKDVKVYPYGRYNAELDATMKIHPGTNEYNIIEIYKWNLPKEKIDSFKDNLIPTKTMWLYNDESSPNDIPNLCNKCKHKAPNAKDNYSNICDDCRKKIIGHNVSSAKSEYAISRYFAQKHCIILSQMESSFGFVATGPTALTDQIKALPLSNFCEIINPYQKPRFYMDVDAWVSIENIDKTRQKIIKLIKTIKERLNVPIWVAENSRRKNKKVEEQNSHPLIRKSLDIAGYKLSYHVYGDIYFKSQTHLKEWIKQQRFDSEFININGEKDNCIDMCVYSIKRKIRIPFTLKSRDDKHMNLPAEIREIGITKSTDIYKYMASCWWMDYKTYEDPVLDKQIEEQVNKNSSPKHRNVQNPNTHDNCKIQNKITMTLFKIESLLNLLNNLPDRFVTNYVEWLKIITRLKSIKLYINDTNLSNVREKLSLFNQKFIDQYKLGCLTDKEPEEAYMALIAVRFSARMRNGSYVYKGFNANNIIQKWYNGGLHSLCATYSWIHNLESIIAENDKYMFDTNIIQNVVEEKINRPYIKKSLIDGDEKVLMIKSSTGSGKTTAVIQWVKDKINESYKYTTVVNKNKTNKKHTAINKITAADSYIDEIMNQDEEEIAEVENKSNFLFLVSRKSLANDIHKKMIANGIDCNHYLNKNKDFDSDIYCINSIEKIPNKKKYRYIIIDEIDSLIKSLLGNLLINKFNTIATKLHMLFNHTSQHGKMILIDYNISSLTFVWVKNILHNFGLSDNAARLLWNQNPGIKQEANIYPSKSQFWRRFEELLIEGKRIMFCCDSRSNIAESLEYTLEKRGMQNINSKNKKYKAEIETIDCDLEDKIKTKTINRTYKFAMITGIQSEESLNHLYNEDINLIISTQKIEYGVDLKNFDYVFGFFKQNVNDNTSIVQHLTRVRKTKDGKAPEINLYLNFKDNIHDVDDGENYTLSPKLNPIISWDNINLYIQEKIKNGNIEKMMSNYIIQTIDNKKPIYMFQSNFALNDLYKYNTYIRANYVNIGSLMYLLRKRNIDVNIIKSKPIKKLKLKYNFDNGFKSRDIPLYNKINSNFKAVVDKNIDAGTKIVDRLFDIKQSPQNVKDYSRMQINMRFLLYIYTNLDKMISKELCDIGITDELHNYIKQFIIIKSMLLNHPNICNLKFNNSDIDGILATSYCIVWKYILNALPDYFKSLKKENYKKEEILKQGERIKKCLCDLKIDIDMMPVTFTPCVGFEDKIFQNQSDHWYPKLKMLNIEEKIMFQMIMEGKLSESIIDTLLHLSMNQFKFLMLLMGNNSSILSDKSDNPLNDNEKIINILISMFRDNITLNFDKQLDVCFNNGINYIAVGNLYKMLTTSKRVDRPRQTFKFCNYSDNIISMIEHNPVLCDIDEFGNFITWESTQIPQNNCISLSRVFSHTYNNIIKKIQSKTAIYDRRKCYIAYNENLMIYDSNKANVYGIGGSKEIDINLQQDFGVKGISGLKRKGWVIKYQTLHIETAETFKWFQSLKNLTK